MVATMVMVPSTYLENKHIPSAFSFGCKRYNYQDLTLFFISVFHCLIFLGYGHQLYPWLTHRLASFFMSLKPYFVDYLNMVLL